MVAKALVLAEADGIKTHGLLRTAFYASQAKAGKVDGFATPAAKKPRPGVLVIDANNGFAYPAIDLGKAVVRIDDEHARPVWRSGVAKPSTFRAFA